MSQSKNNKPKVFISHAWENKPVVRQLEERLRAAGADVWVDHVGIRGGDSLPKRISDALEWCDTLVLVWSEASRASEWVALEWENAISLKKLIIPCLLDETRLPGIMARMAYISFHQIDQGIITLLHALGLNDRLVTKSPSAKAKEISVPYNPLVVSPDIVARQKKAAFDPTTVAPAQKHKTHSLRSRPMENLTPNEAKAMLVEKGFCDSIENLQGRGLQHQYEIVKRKGKNLVIDHTTGLMWQQSGSDEEIDFKEVQKYIQKLKHEKFAGYDDWRLPTLEEAMSLMERKKKNGELYIDPVFDKNQRWIWTADKLSSSVAWYVTFGTGIGYNDGSIHYSHVRAVRSVR